MLRTDSRFLHLVTKLHSGSSKCLDDFFFIFRTIIPIYIHSYEPDLDAEEEDTVISDDEDVTTTRLADSSLNPELNLVKV